MAGQTKKAAAPSMMSDGILMAIEEIYRRNMWPSAANVARALGYRQLKLTGRANRDRKRILRTIYGM